VTHRALRGEIIRVAGLLIIVSAMFACSSQPSSTASRPPEPSVAATPRAPQPHLWGELKPIVSVKELMRDMLDPAADYIFDAVKIVYTKKDAVVTTPKTEKDWDKIRIGAVTLAEGVYLLKIPRPFAPAGDENNSKGPDATELSPAQMKAKLEADPVLWNAKIEALRNVGLEVLEIVKTKKVDELWEAGDNLDQACESCHLQYWYPGDKALLQKLDRDIQERYEQSQRAGKTGRGR
jgi:cytochrome c556